MSVLLDAGPSLNFLAVGQENVLIKVAEAARMTLAVPQRVEREILGVSQDPRFARTPVRSTWGKLTRSGRIQVLDDTLKTRQFVDAVTRISGRPAHERVRSGRSLGEIMVLAHASVLVQAREHVYVLIDETDGRQRARREMAWLQDDSAPGSLSLWSTPQVLKQASRRKGWIKGDLTWETVYSQMRKFDDGLPML